MQEIGISRGSRRSRVASEISSKWNNRGDYMEGSGGRVPDKIAHLKSHISEWLRSESRPKTRERSGWFWQVQEETGGWVKGRLQWKEEKKERGEEGGSSVKDVEWRLGNGKKIPLTLMGFFNMGATDSSTMEEQWWLDSNGDEREAEGNIEGGQEEANVETDRGREEDEIEEEQGGSRGNEDVGQVRGTGEEKTILQSETPELLTTLSLSSRCGVVGTPGEGDGTRGCNNLGGSGNKEK